MMDEYERQWVQALHDEYRAGYAEAEKEGKERFYKMFILSGFFWAAIFEVISRNV